jgi:type VI protein secretion system component Hcp
MAVVDYFLKIDGIPGESTDAKQPVSSYQTAGVSAEVPHDSVSLSFSKIEVSYKEQKADGSLGQAIRVGWDRKTSKQF